MILARRYSRSVPIAELQVMYKFQIHYLQITARINRDLLSVLEGLICLIFNYVKTVGYWSVGQLVQNALLHIFEKFWLFKLKAYHHDRL